MSREIPRAQKQCSIIRKNTMWAVLSNWTTTMSAVQVRSLPCRFIWRLLDDYNVGRAGQILTLPFYMAFLLTVF